MGNLRNDKELMRKTLITENIASENEINLVSNINGDSELCMLDILYARTGYNNFTQYIESELSMTDEEYIEDVLGL